MPAASSGGSTAGEEGWESGGGTGAHPCRPAWGSNAGERVQASLILQFRYNSIFKSVHIDYRRNRRTAIKLFTNKYEKIKFVVYNSK
jgi:hypothetical protein